MIKLIEGQNTLINSQSIELILDTASKPNGIDLDISAFILNPTGKVSNDNDFIFFNNPAAPNKGIYHQPERHNFTLQLDKIPHTHKVMFAMSITSGIARQQNFEMTKLARFILKDYLTGLELAVFEMSTQNRSETALIMAEIYSHNNHWKIRAIGQGFTGGLKPLAELYGVDIGEDESDSITETKITLEKTGHSISLEKRPSGYGEIVINLNWNTQPKKQSGLLFQKSTQIDLDLACLFEMKNGLRGGVQALGNNFGNYQQTPYIELDADDRSGIKTDGENLRINGQQWQDINRILIFAFIYEGIPNWGYADAIITIKVPSQPSIEIQLDSHRNDQYLCAVAMLENENNEIRVTKLIDYFNGHQEMDQAFGWGLQYIAGNK